MTLDEYKRNLIDELREKDIDTERAFINYVFDLFKQERELIDPKECYFKKTFGSNRVMQINGYNFDEADKSLSLIISDFENNYYPNDINRKQIEEVLSKRLKNFLEIICEHRLIHYCDDSNPIIDVSNFILDTLKDTQKLKFYIITNKKISEKVKKIKAESFCKDKYDIPLEINVWHLEYLYQRATSIQDDVIYIDFKKDFDIDGIPCIKANIGKNLNYSAYMAVISGKLLASIYYEFGSRILEGNVRAFLGLSAKGVNAGIKKTIKECPEYFFTYNNGIAVTCSKLETKLKENQLYITGIEDLQIINGGQTTATLTTLLLSKNKDKDNFNLEKIFVPMKITVIEDRQSTDENGTRIYDKMVQNISEYANKQNKVTNADFSSNNPFHINMERLSKNCGVLVDSVNTTYWYYERSRKKYNQELFPLNDVEQKKFKKKYPKNQIITKEKLAKYLYSIECKPDIVSKGANYLMKEFGKNIDKQYQIDSTKFNEVYFKKCVAKAIIFNTVDDIVKNAEWYPKGGYKGNIVPYTISKIVSSIPNGYSINYNRIWNNQTLDNAFIEEIKIVAKMTNDFITNTNDGVIVTEYCKKPETWEKYKKVPYIITDKFRNTLSFD